jgi:uncharacterized protein (DUF1800 family)
MTMRRLRLFATGLSLALLSCTKAPSLAPEAATVPPQLEPALDAATSAHADPDDVPRSELERARRLLMRCSFGPRPGEVARVARLGPERWLDEQLAGPAESPLFEAALVPHRRALVPPAELVASWLGDDWDDEPDAMPELRREARPHFREHLQRLASAELTRAILSSRQLEAVMTHFWANHFNIYAAKGFVRLYAGDYLERAIRPHALGRFEDLLVATARHPAMLIYLDNVESTRERAGGRGRARGLNENYARELLELHTLGADGGYTQQDVREVARILTGYSVERINRGRFEFQFKARAHDRGEKTVLGEVFPAGGGEEEGLRLLGLLAAHPATARHLARKLCVRFVADQPPRGCLTAAAQAYSETRGDIRSVIKAIVSEPSFWSEPSSKLKTPLELVASTARALELMPDGDVQVVSVLDELGAPLLYERVPTGYPDREIEWASTGGMLARLNFAAAIARNELPGMGLDVERLLPNAESEALLRRLDELLLQGRASARTLAVVGERLEELREPRMRRELALALFVGSPEFQRR